MDTNELIQSVAEGKELSEAISEAMDHYSMGYRLDELLPQVSRSVSDARSLLMKCKASMPSLSGSTKSAVKKAHDLLASAHKKLEDAESDVLASSQAVEEYKASMKGAM